ncbi:MAG: hypothetical protein WD072_07280 [Pirellulales bacterium]
MWLIAWLVLGLICLVTFAHMAWKTNQTTLTNDVYPTATIGTVSGILAFGTGLGGTLFTWLMGYCVEWFGYGMTFVVMGLLHPLSYLVTRWLGGPGSPPLIASGPGVRIASESPVRLRSRKIVR